MEHQFVIHSPSSTFYLTNPEAHRLLDELEMALDHPEDDVVVADVEMSRDEASDTLSNLK